MSTVLIADDNRDLLDILTRRFEALGHQVIQADNGAAALASAKELRPDLIILDVMMPELNGYQVARRLKSDGGFDDTPVILLTAKDSEADKFWGMEVGADLYLTKPTDPAVVAEEGERLLNAK